MKMLEPDDVPPITPKLLRMKLAEYDIKVGDFAKLANVSYATISGYMHGKINISKLMRYRLDTVIRQLDEEADTIAELEAAEEANRLQKRIADAKAQLELASAKVS
jgi:plasmid maintenance system antidote protein VapI